MKLLGQAIRIEGQTEYEDASCGTCCFWHDGYQCRKKSPELSPHAEMVVPPVGHFILANGPGGMKQTTVWPQTGPTDWCGDYQRKYDLPTC